MLLRDDGFNDTCMRRKWLDWRRLSHMPISTAAITKSATDTNIKNNLRSIQLDMVFHRLTQFGKSTRRFIKGASILGRRV